MKESYTHYMLSTGLKEARETMARKYREENNVNTTLGKYKKIRKVKLILQHLQLLLSLHFYELPLGVL